MRSHLSLWGRPLCPSKRDVPFIESEERQGPTLGVRFSEVPDSDTAVEVYVKEESTVFSTGFIYRSKINIQHAVSLTLFNRLAEMPQILHYSFNRLF